MGSFGRPVLGWATQAYVRPRRPRLSRTQPAVTVSVAFMPAVSWEEGSVRVQARR